MNELDLNSQPATNPLPRQIFSQDRLECRLCGAHVHLGYRSARNAAAWCSGCSAASVYDFAPRHTTA